MKSLLKDLNWKFGFLMSLLIVAVMLAEQALLMKQTRVGMESRVAEKASFINTFYAFLIADALQRKDDVTLLQVINRLEDDPEILSVIVVDNKGEVRYHADSEKLGTQWNDPLIQKALDTNDGIMTTFQNSGGKALALVSPLKLQGMAHPIGAVRIDMTYRHIQDQLGKFETSFHMAALGFISAAVGLMMAFLRRWVTLPLENTEKALAGLHLATAEPHFPESPDEFGRLNKALNEMILRFRVELQDQLGTGPARPEDLEKDLVECILRLFPHGRILMADKDNRIISSLDHGQNVGTRPDHLLDLITDVNFANLVGAAFQNEGEILRGTVLFENRPSEAAVMCVPERQSKVIKTVIVLVDKSEKGAA
jgi:hypothetical protein